jgi:hypothetical protein
MKIDDILRIGSSIKVPIIEWGLSNFCNFWTSSRIKSRRNF